MGRSPCCDKNGLKKGPWTPEEDKKLLDYIQEHGHGSWISLPKRAGLNRCGKSCRLRWINYLRPDIKRGNFSAQEEETILRLHCILGNKWSSIAARLPGRTDNEIKNYWNTHLKKKLLRMGLDPVTHQPRTDLFSSLQNLLALANLRNLMSHPPLDDNNSSLEFFQADQAVQLANKLHQLQDYLLQSIPPSLAQYNINIQDIESYSNMLNWVPPLKDISTEGFMNSSPSSSSSHFAKLEDNNSFCVGAATTPMCSQPLHHTTNVVDSLLSNLVGPQQVPFHFQTSLNISDHHEMSQFPIVNQMNNNNDDDDNNNNNNNNNSFLLDSQWGGLSSPNLLPPSSHTNTTSSLSNLTGEASGASSYGRGSSCPWQELVLDEAIVNDISC